MRLIGFIIFLNFHHYGLCDCPLGSDLGVNNVCYTAINIPSTWFQSEASCRQLGGDLCSVRDAFTNAFLAGLADGPFNHQNYWLGGTTNLLNGSWAWIDFTNFTYVNWNAGPPNNALGYCIAQNLPNGKWFSADCSLQKPFVCEFAPITSCNTTTTVSTSGTPITQITTTTGSASTATGSTSTTNNLVSTGSTPATPCGKPQTCTRNLCPNGDWLYSNVTQKCYLFVVDSIDYTTSQAYCQENYNASLVIIHSSYENSLLTNYSYTKNDPSEDWWFWIGLKGYAQNNTLGNYSWIDGSCLDYQNWGADQRPTLNQCVHMDPSNSYLGYWWGDVCDAETGSFYFGFICELCN